MNLTAFSIHHRVTVFVMMFVIVVFGVYSYITLPRESFPDITVPYIIVTTPYEGVAPSDIENLITRHIEKKVSSIDDVKELRSYSSDGMSTIVVEFESGIKIDTALQKVRDKVNEAKQDIPDDLKNDPAINEINFSEFPIMTVIVYGDAGLVRLKDLADDLKDDFETIPGVLEANVIGGLEREIRIVYEPERLSSYHLSVTGVMQSVIMNNLNTPGGDIDIGQGNYLVKIPGEFQNPAEAQGLIVSSNKNKPVYITDVAGLEDGYKKLQSKSRLNGREAISIDIVKRSGQNILEISDKVKAIVDKYRIGMPEGVKITCINDQSKDISMMVSDLENSIACGLVLVVAVVVFSMGLRNSMLVASAIPLSMLITFFTLQMLGYTLNMIVLFSLVLASGRLVDDAIVVVENIYRHLHEGKDRYTACIEATHEVLGPVAASTFTTVSGFFPLIFWPDVIGEFMSYLPVTVIISLLASLFVAVIVNPTLCFVFLKRPRGIKTEKTGLAKRGYTAIIRGAVNYPFYTLACSLALLLLTFKAYSIFGNGIEFFPKVDPPRAYINVKMPKGTNLEDTDKYMRIVEEATKGYPDIKNVVANVGSTGTGGDSFLSGGKFSSDIGVVALEFEDFHKRSVPSVTVLKELREKLKPVYEPDIEIKEEEAGPPKGAPVSIEISGESYEVLEKMMLEIYTRIRPVPGLVDLKDDYVMAKPEVVVKVDKQKAALLGLNTQIVAQNVKAAIRGIDAGKYREGNDEYDIVVKLPEYRRKDLYSLYNLRLSLPAEGRSVPISSVADIELTGGLGTIVRIDQKRVITVEGKVEGRLSTEVLNDVKQKLANLDIPRGYKLRYRGENEDQEKTATFLVKAFVFAMFLILLILVTEFNSFYKPLVISSSVLLSTMGVLWGLMVMHQPFGIVMTGIGVISLAGVVVNNAIVLLAYVDQLRERGYGKKESLIHAGIVRFRPVYLTATTTVLGLIPMALGIVYDFRQGGWQIGSESAQWWSSMAYAVIFGLTIATVLTLVVVPAMVSAGDLFLEKWHWLRAKLGFRSGDEAYD